MESRLTARAFGAEFGVQQAPPFPPDSRLPVGGRAWPCSWLATNEQQMHSAAGRLIVVGLWVLLNSCGNDTAGPLTSMEVRAVAGNRQVIVYWTPLDTFHQYNLYRSTARGVTPSKANLVYSETEYGWTAFSSDVVDRCLTNGTTYYYVFTAVDGEGKETAPSSEVSATPLGSFQLPPTPPQFAVQPTSGGATLSWSGVPGVRIYEVYGDTTPGTLITCETLDGHRLGEFLSVWEGAPADNVQLALPSGSAWYLSVTAVTDAGESLPSREIAVTPL